MPESSKAKGDLLEEIINALCSRFSGAKVETNVRIRGKSGVERQIDTLITGRIGAFPATIVVDAKNHATPIDIGEVERVGGLASDVGANLGVIVCPTGFTSGAKRRADSLGIQIYEIYHEDLGNSDLLVPLRYVEARIEKYAYKLSATSAAGQFRIPFDQSGLCFHIETQVLEAKQLPIYAWNKLLVPQRAGEYAIELGPVKITDTRDASYVQYCDLNLQVVVAEDYYLKLVPASFLRRAGDIQEHYDLKLDIYQKKEDMLRNGWSHFDTLEEMNAAAAKVDSQAPNMQGLIFRTEYTWKEPE